MDSRLVQRSIAAVLSAAALALIAWAVRTFVETVLLVDAIMGNVPDNVDTNLLALVIVVVLVAVAYLLASRLKAKIGDE